MGVWQLICLTVWTSENISWGLRDEDSEFTKRVAGSEVIIAFLATDEFWTGTFAWNSFSFKQNSLSSKVPLLLKVDKELSRIMMISLTKRSCVTWEYLHWCGMLDEPSTRMCLQAALKGADVATHLSPVVDVFGDPSHLDRTLWWCKESEKMMVSSQVVWKCGRQRGGHCSSWNTRIIDVGVILGLFMVVPTLKDGDF